MFWLNRRYREESEDSPSVRSDDKSVQNVDETLKFPSLNSLGDEIDHYKVDGRPVAVYTPFHHSISSKEGILRRYKKKFSIHLHTTYHEDNCK